MARFTFKLPDIGEGISEAEIVAWHVKVGERVEEDQQVADMMTDKATVEMESPVSGVVVELAGEVGDQVSIGAALVVIETDAEADVSAEEAPALRVDEPAELNVAPASAEQVEVAQQYEAENPGVEEVVPSPASTSSASPAEAGEGRRVGRPRLSRGPRACGGSRRRSLADQGRGRPHPPQRSRRVPPLRRRSRLSRPARLQRPRGRGDQGHRHAPPHR